MSIDDFDAMECHEAFAAHRTDVGHEFARHGEVQPAGWRDREIGHPLGASGVRIMTTMLNHLRGHQGRSVLGLQTMCAKAAARRMPAG